MLLTSSQLSEAQSQCVYVCVVRLQQLDQHCQASSQQVLQLLSRQKQLMQERVQVSLPFTLVFFTLL